MLFSFSELSGMVVFTCSVSLPTSSTILRRLPAASGPPRTSRSDEVTASMSFVTLPRVWKTCSMAPSLMTLRISPPGGIRGGIEPGLMSRV